MDFEGFMHFAIGGKHTAVPYIATPRGASEARSGAARCRLRRTRAPDSLNLPIFLQAASRGASEPRSGAARYRLRWSRAPDSVNLPIYCHSSPVRKNTVSIRKVQPHMNQNVLPVPWPSQVSMLLWPRSMDLGPIVPDMIPCAKVTHPPAFQFKLRLKMTFHRPAYCHRM